MLWEMDEERGVRFRQEIPRDGTECTTIAAGM